jgi:hypothetical protein
LLRCACRTGAPRFNPDSGPLSGVSGAAPGFLRISRLSELR